MQNTRLSSLIDVLLAQLRRWLLNPWRRVSLVVISLLFGFFTGNALSTTTGQSGDIDVLVAAITVSLTEAVSWFVYGRRWGERQPLLIDSLNAFKLGLIYSLFLEAFKLGS
ncbi:DUF565 domain-containing protein [Geitlerinema sp. PCC 7407]|jgi:hypothetical protein|uniref:DUF565 domain-containing protein n=1 Tax=Geitlerinema sp. PCC 7407 TaxID=1173025 RepID=UPI00029F9267|nr:DUF565 domain-containing protein [Geitlerinema sp. PCC 7407]AFY64905.1 hypothetical protein GEI7407_0404 [Geitlerinema sp. PCC 7407]